MKSINKYLAITGAYGVIATASLTAHCIDIYHQNPSFFVISAAGLTLIFLAGVILNDKVLIPRLLMRQHYIYSLIAISIVAAMVVIFGYFEDILIRHVLGLPQRIVDIFSPWIILGSASSCILILFMFLAQGLERLFGIWYKETLTEEKLTTRLQLYMRDIQQRLHPETILTKLREIRMAIIDNKDTVNELILTLSSYLRGQLYDLPAPPVMNSGDLLRPYHWVSDYLSQKKWRVWRHVLFQLALVIVAMDVFFDTPDHPSFTLDNLIGFLGELICFEALTYINVFWLFRLFRKNRNLGKYIRNVGIMITVLIIPLIAVQIWTYTGEIYSRSLPLGLKIITMLGTMVTLSMFIGGIAALLLLQFWVSGQRRLILLRAEIVRQEYAFLKKQINPHFLFNVLNNLGIQSVDQPEEAIDMVLELERLIKYQFTEASLSDTTLEREISFIHSYLTLEKTRHDLLDFEIITSADTGRLFVPTLLFIPFVENAVKFSSVVTGRRLIRIQFSIYGERLVFRCVNTYRKSTVKVFKKDGGLGISNTLRRLDLLYGSEFEYSHSEKADCYEAVLVIPIDMVTKVL